MPQTGTWSISGGDATIDSYGHAWFPQNRTDNSITYTVTFEDGYGCKVSGTTTVPNCPCNCNDLEILASTVEFGNNGGEQVIGVLTPDCAGKFSILGAPNWCDVHLDGYSVVASCSANTTTDDRAAGVNLAIGGTVCGSPTFLIQQSATTAEYSLHIFARVDGGSTVTTPIEVYATYEWGSGTPTTISQYYTPHIDSPTARLSYYDCDGERDSPSGIPLPRSFTICRDVGGGEVQSNGFQVDSLCTYLSISNCTDGQIFMCSSNEQTATHQFTSNNGNVRINVTITARQ